MSASAAWKSARSVCSPGTCARCAWIEVRSSRRRTSFGAARAMTPEEYDAWYRAPRGSWIGETEYRLLREALAPSPGASVLDVGCGTGSFTPRLAGGGFDVTCVDVSAGRI